MNSKLNEKINQVTDTTLVVGMDIAKRKHFATFVDDRGRQLVKAFPVFQSKDGFDYLYERLTDAMKEFGKTDVVIGIEPTGHYWLNLFHLFKRPRDSARHDESDARETLERAG